MQFHASKGQKKSCSGIIQVGTFTHPRKEGSTLSTGTTGIPTPAGGKRRNMRMKDQISTVPVKAVTGWWAGVAQDLHQKKGARRYETLTPALPAETQQISWVQEEETCLVPFKSNWSTFHFISSLMFLLKGYTCVTPQHGLSKIQCYKVLPAQVWACNLIFINIFNLLGSHF